MFSFLCIVEQKKNLERSEIFWKFFIFENLLHKKRLKGRISIYADFGPPRYVLWCCVGICHEVLTFFQIGCGHTVPWFWRPWPDTYQYLKDSMKLVTCIIWIELKEKVQIINLFVSKIVHDCEIFSIYTSKKQISQCWDIINF